MRENIEIQRIMSESLSPSVFLMRLHAPLDDTTLTEFSLACSPRRLKQAADFHFMNDRARCLGVGWLLQHALKELGLVSKSGPVYEDKDPAGKPYLPDFPDRSISFAHSGEWIACAIHDSPVGIDVENLLSLRESAITEQFMSPLELNHYRDLKDLHSSYSTRVWVMKEAFLKALGVGLMTEPKNVTVHELLRDQASAGPWLGYEADLQWQYRLAVCWRKEGVL